MSVHLSSVTDVKYLSRRMVITTRYVDVEVDADACADWERCDGLELDLERAFLTAMYPKEVEILPASEDSISMSAVKSVK